jgi:hypothetical protein
VLLETLGFMLKVGTCHYTGEFFFPEKQGFENGLFSPFLVIFLSSQYQVPLYISTPSNSGGKCHHGF